MKQSRLESLIEINLNILSGFLLSMLIQALVIVPLWNLPLQMHDNFAIVVIYTVAAYFRNYFWRRFFAHRIHKRKTATTAETFARSTER